MITCVKKLSITVVRVLSFLVNSFEKLFLSQDTFFKNHDTDFFTGIIQFILWSITILYPWNRRLLCRFFVIYLEFQTSV